MAWHTYIKYWEVYAKLNTCILKAYVFAVQTPTQASQATGSQQKPQTQQKTLKGISSRKQYIASYSSTWSLLQVKRVLVILYLCQKLFLQHRPSPHPFLLCFIGQYRNCQFYSLHCCTGLCNPHSSLKLTLKGLVGTDLQAEKVIKASEEKRILNSNDLCK